MLEIKRCISPIIVMAIMLSVFPLATCFSSTLPTDSQLHKATAYLITMYNPTLGLVANSEDQGPNPYGEGVPCNRTYWVYSDNLWAGWALQPFTPTIAENITKTVQRYTTEQGRSMLFEAVIGEPIPTTIRANKDIKAFDGIVNGIRVQVLLDRHQSEDNPGIFDDADKYADLCCYLTINYWMMGDINASRYWFQKGEALWNHTTNHGFYDKAVYDVESSTHNRYQNFKLGLFLMAQRVTGFMSIINEYVEAKAWSYQNNLGGITTQSKLDGTFFGTANAETTSALLLAYNEDLINILHERQSYAEYLLDIAENELNTTRSQLIESQQTIAELYGENSILRNWLTILLVSTIGLAITTTILVVWKKIIKNR